MYAENIPFHYRQRLLVCQLVFTDAPRLSSLSNMANSSKLRAIIIMIRGGKYIPVLVKSCLTSLTLAIMY